MLTPEMRHALAASSTYCAVERRLQRGGALRELHHLRGLSDDELDVLTARERHVDISLTVPDRAR